MLPKDLYIEKQDGAIHSQAIEFEWAPNFYLDYMHKGHSTGNCPNSNKPTKPKKPVPRDKA